MAIARAVLREPAMLVLDEPTSSMDFTTEEALKEKLRRFAEHRTLLLVTHRNSLMDLVDRLIVIEGGRIVLDGPKNEVVAALKTRAPARA